MSNLFFLPTTKFFVLTPTKKEEPASQPSTAAMLTESGREPTQQIQPKKLFGTPDQPDQNVWTKIWQWIVMAKLDVIHTYYAYKDKGNWVDKDALVLVVMHKNYVSVECPYPQFLHLVSLPLDPPIFPAYIDRFDEYVASDRSGVWKSMKLMNDPNCIALVTLMKDMVAISPCALDNGNGGYTLGLELIRTSMEYEDYRNFENSTYEHIYYRGEDGKHRLQLSTGEFIPVVVVNGWYMTRASGMFKASQMKSETALGDVTEDPAIKIFPGTSFCIEGVEGYGTMGCVLQKQGEYFMMTCEHIVNEIRSRRDTATNITTERVQFPSITFKKTAIIRNAAPGKRITNREITQPHKHGFPAILEAPYELFETLFDNTIDSLQSFVNNQFSCEMSIEDTPRLKDNTEVSIKDDANCVVNGDVNLMKVPSELENQFLHENYMPMKHPGIHFHHKVFTLQEMCKRFEMLAKDPEDNKCIDVLKQSVHYGVTIGQCNRLSHVKELPPIDDLPIIAELERPSLQRYLFNQIRIVGDNSFGLCGDSGSLVFAKVESRHYYPLGIFIGSLDNGQTGQTQYLATPIEYLTNQGFEIYPL